MRRQTESGLRPAWRPKADVTGGGAVGTAIVVRKFREIDPFTLEAAQRGDRAAFDAIVDLYDERLRLLAFHLLHDVDLADDALQDTFFNAYRGLPAFGRRVVARHLALPHHLHGVHGLPAAAACGRASATRRRRSSSAPMPILPTRTSPAASCRGARPPEPGAACRGPARRSRRLRLPLRRRGARRAEGHRLLAPRRCAGGAAGGADRGASPASDAGSRRPSAPGRGGDARERPARPRSRPRVRLLATLEAPPAKERFHERLWERIDAVERRTPPSTRGAGIPRGAARREHFHERLWERIDAAEPVEATKTSAGRASRAALGVPAAAARRRGARRGRRRRVGGGVADRLADGPRTGRPGGPPPAVAQVIENVRLRLDSCRSLSAVFTYQRAGAPVFRARVVATSDGRVRTSAIADEDGSWRLPPADATLADTPGLHVEVTSMPDGTRTEAWHSGDGSDCHARPSIWPPDRRTPPAAGSSRWSTQGR